VGPSSNPIVPALTRLFREALRFQVKNFEKKEEI
jgi:hypothetical protein